MNQFQRMEIFDFKVLAFAVLELAERGLVLVRGHNNDTEAADSNGAGKSTLFEALSWCLFGQFVGCARPGAEVIRKGKKSATVTIWLKTPEHAYEICRSYEKKMELGLRVDGVERNGKTREETQQAIIDILGLDWDAFRNTVLYGQGDVSRFGDPGVSDGERKAILKRILRLDRFNTALERVRAAKKVLAGKVAAAETRAHKADGAISASQIQVIQLSQTADLWEASHAFDLRTAQGQLAELAEVKPVPAETLERLETIEAAMEEKIELLRHAETKCRRLEAAVSAAQATWSTAQLEVRHAERELKAAEKEYAEAGNFSPLTCPKCGTVVDNKDPGTWKDPGMWIAQADRCMQEAHGELTAAKEKERAAQTKVDELQETLAGAVQEEAELAKWPDKLTEVRRQLKKLRAQRSQWESVSTVRAVREQRLADLQTAVNPHRDSLEEASRRVAEAQLEKQKVDIELLRLQAELHPLLFWEEAFSDRGIPSFAMDAVVAMISESANRYLRILADGDLKVTVSTQTELKSGGSKEAIDLQFDVEGAGDVRPSGGQRRKLSIAIDLALMELVATREGAQIDLLLLDEIFEGLDGEGAKRVVDLLKHLRETKGSIFVIAHDERVTDGFENFVHVVKGGGASTVV